jgi:hypothetical protein
MEAQYMAGERLRELEAAAGEITLGERATLRRGSSRRLVPDVLNALEQRETKFGGAPARL